MTLEARADLHRAIDELPPADVHAARRFIGYLRSQSDSSDGLVLADGHVDIELEEPIESSQAGVRAAGAEDSLLEALRVGVRAVNRFVKKESELRRITGMQQSVWRLQVDNARVQLRVGTEGSTLMVTTQPATELRRATPRALVEGEFLAPEEVAELLHVDGSTVRRWISTGHLPADRGPGPRARYRVRKADALALDSKPSSPKR